MGIMTADKLIPVSETVWSCLTEMKRPGQTYDEVLSEIIEREKERRFLDDIAAIVEEEGDFDDFPIDCVIDGEESMNRFLVVIEKAGDNYSAYSPDLPGCVATGATRKETEERMREAIKLHVGDEPDC